ncbi:MAG: aminotransferase class IV, partial [Gaiellaceae bacterium]
LEAHLDRLGASAESIGLPPVEGVRLQVLAGLVLPKAERGDATLRLIWTAGPAGGPPSGVALLGEIPAWIEEARERGASCVSLLGVRAAVPWLLPGVKSTSYAVNMAAEAEAKRRGVDEAVFVDGDGVVLEGTVTNVWWRSGDVLRTPSLDLGILAGVTRATLIELAPGCGYRVEEGSYPLEDLLRADEAFTSSSVREIMPLIEIDGRPVGRGPAADELQQALRALAAKV